MTDKEQIIIDGVDVKNCRRRIGKNNYCRYFKRLCSENNFNCVWKQLARKTQECEGLKEKNTLLESQMAFNLSEMGIRLGNEVNRSETLLKELKRFDKIKDEYREMSEKLKAEEKYLKQCCAKAGEELAKHSFDYDGKEKNLVVQAMELNEKYKKLEKALEEIENLVQTVSDADECSYGDFDCCNCDNDNSCPTKVKRLILAIINKAKGEGNE